MGIKVLMMMLKSLALPTNFLEAVLCELAVVGKGQPCVVAGDFNVEPNKIPCLLKGILNGLWFDLQGAWSVASGVDAGVTCKKVWASTGGTRRDFILGCPLAAAALDSCWVDDSRWIQPHFAVVASFQRVRWSVEVTQPCRVTPLWPAFWVLAVDRTRSSRSVEVRDIWDVYVHVLQFIPGGDADRINSALLDRDIDLAWEAWSAAAERSLATAMREAGGPMPSGGLEGGRGRARFQSVRLGGKRMCRYRPSLVEPLDATEVHLFRSQSVAPLLTAKKRLRCVACLLSAVVREGFTLARGLELNEQWSCIVRAGPIRCLDWVSLVNGPRAGVMEFQVRVNDAIEAITSFVKRVVFSRRDSALQGWRNWVLEDPLVYPRARL